MTSLHDIQKAQDSIESVDAFPHEVVGEVQSLLDQLVRIEAPEKLEALAMSWLALNPIPASKVVDANVSERRDEYCFGLRIQRSPNFRQMKASWLR